MSTMTSQHNGFTLIELIATLIVAGLVGGLVLPFFYAGAFKSKTAIDHVEDSRNLQIVLENAMSYYFNPDNGFYDPDTIADLQRLQDQTSGPMVDFANWLDTNWDDLSGTEEVKSLDVEYPYIPKTSDTHETGPSPYSSDNSVVRIKVQHKSGLRYVLYVGQDNQ